MSAGEKEVVAVDSRKCQHCDPLKDRVAELTQILQKRRDEGMIAEVSKIVAELRYKAWQKRASADIGRTTKAYRDGLQKQADALDAYATLLELREQDQEGFEMEFPGDKTNANLIMEAQEKQNLMGITLTASDVNDPHFGE